MNPEKIIDVTEQPATAVALREQTVAVDRPLTLDEIHEQLEFIKAVMAREMKEGHDYGKVPGCGDKPGLFQPGAQKLCLTFRLSPKVGKEVLRDFGNHHREYEFTLTLVSASGREWDGVGTCSTLESKYRYRKAERRCPQCGKHTIIVGKEEYGGGYICFKKKGGCGAKFAYSDPKIANQPAGKVEHDNPADYWNTVRKMAFKRALVHASIMATNTSELWSQDIEDIPNDEEPAAENGAGQAEGVSEPSLPLKTPQKGRQGPSQLDKKQLEKLLNWLEKKCKEQFLKLIKPLEAAAKQYAIEQNWILPNEELSAVNVTKLFPSVDLTLGIQENWLKVKVDYDTHLKAIDKIATGSAWEETAAPNVELPAPENGNGNGPEQPGPAPAKSDEPPPELPKGVLQFVGQIESISKQQGTSSRGPWTRYGIKSGDIWFNTFSQTVGTSAMMLEKKKKQARFWYTKDEKGNTLHHLEAAMKEELL